jgi:hypothetical protein
MNAHFHCCAKRNNPSRDRKGAVVAGATCSAGIMAAPSLDDVAIVEIAAAGAKCS